MEKIMLRKALQFLFISLALTAGPALAADPIKVVYHINEGVEKAAMLLRNVKNHLAAEPGVKIVVVGHNAGIDFMLQGAQDKNGNPFDVPMEELADKGVEFKVCRNTLTGRSIPESKVQAPATIVPSGVAEVARLQGKEGFVYLKP
jgi:intracellular sulfur oxidation DsrE/DsrF family protein